MAKENGKWHLFIQVYQHSFVLILIKKKITLSFFFLFFPYLSTKSVSHEKKDIVACIYHITTFLLLELDKFTSDVRK